MSARVLILGATGMLGHMACRVFGERFEAHATSRRPEDAAIVGRPGMDRVHWHWNLDALSEDELEALVERVRPDWVFNSVGVVKQKDEAEDPVLTIRVNALLPHQLAALGDKYNFRLLQMSTDCVFSGRGGMYSESSEPDPQDLYGRSKLLGEVIASKDSSASSRHLTIRTSIIGPQLDGNWSLLEWFLSQAGGAVKGFQRAIFSGLTTRALCDVLAQIIESPDPPTGLFHVAAEPISKLDLLSRVNEVFDLKIRIEPDERFVCDRSLDGTAFIKSTGIEVPSWDSMIAQLSADQGHYVRIQ